MVSKSEDKLVDFDYLKRFKSKLEGLIEDGFEFFIVLGGGYLMRKYRAMARAGGIEEDLQIHWIGTTCNLLNAEVVRAFLYPNSTERIVAYEDYYNEYKPEFTKPIIVGGGGRAGHSGDVDALVMANKLGIDTIVSLKDIDGVYSDDPDKNPNAKRIKKLTWDEYLNIIGNPQKHHPGASYPIDPIASRMAKESAKAFAVIGGEDLSNFERLMKGEEFNGSVVS